MIRIAASALALAAAGLVASAPAEAAPRCSCAKPHKVRHHHRAKPRRHVVRTVVENPVVMQTAVVTTTKATVEAETYVSPESRYLPDPQHDDHAVWPAGPREIAIASALNRTLDVWRTCSWRGQEEAAAAFVAWSRTHTVGQRDRVAGLDAVPAWKPFARASAQHVTYLEDADAKDGANGFNQQPIRCDVTQGERAAMREDMDTQARELAKAHALAHRPLR